MNALEAIAIIEAFPTKGLRLGSAIGLFLVGALFAAAALTVGETTLLGKALAFIAFVFWAFAAATLFGLL